MNPTNSDRRELQARRPPAIVQTLILAKTRFRTVDTARTWVREHGFKTSHEGKGPDETETSWRFRQRAPGSFRPGTFRTISITRGVQAVVGRLKSEQRQQSTP